MGFETKSCPAPGDRPERWLWDETDFDLVHQNNYADASYGGSWNGKSWSGVVVQVGGGPVRWVSRVQSLVALSTAEAEIYAAVVAAKELEYQRILMRDLGMGDLERPARLYEDNSAAIALGKELKTRSSARHYVLRLRWLQMAVVQNRLQLVHCPTQHQMLTSPRHLPRMISCDCADYSWAILILVPRL